MSGQRVVQNFVNLRYGPDESRSGDAGNQTGNRDMAVRDQSVEDFVSFEGTSPLVTNALGLMGYQIPQVGFEDFRNF